MNLPTAIVGLGWLLALIVAGLRKNLMSEIQLSLAFARGVPGVMRPSPEAADSDSAVALLKYAAAIQSADEPKEPKYRPEWLWNLASKIALRYWQWRYKGLAEARVREWYEQSRTTIPARSHAVRGANPATQTRKKLN
jgi:hypothetical protein